MLRPLFKHVKALCADRSDETAATSVSAYCGSATMFL